MEKNLTTGSVFKTILYFALPYLFSYFLQTLYGMSDLFIIGQFNGTESTTAVANGSQVMHMLTVMIVGLAMGSTVMIGRAVGARHKDEIAKTVGNSVTLFMGLSIILTIVLLLLVRPIVLLIQTPDEAIEGSIRYLTICFIGIPFITAYNIIASIFRGMGDSKSPMYFIAIGVLHMGAAGAALGTTLAQTLSVIISLLMTKKKKLGIKLCRQDFIPSRAVLGEILKIGIPVAIQDGCIQIAFIIITVIANSRGLNDAAAVGIVEKVISALFIVPSSMLATVSALAAQNIGAGKHDRASKTLKYAILITFTYGIIVAIIGELITAGIVGIFTKDAAVVVLGTQYLRGYIVDCALAGIHFCFSGYFCAYGKSYIGFIHNMIAIICLRVPGSYLASKFFADTLFPMGLAAPAGSMLSVIICVGAFIWMKKHGRLGDSQIQDVA